jgi:hypothetical protein
VASQKHFPYHELKLLFLIIPGETHAQKSVRNFHTANDQGRAFDFYTIELSEI